MHTVFRLLATSSLAVCLMATASARTRPNYGGTLRVETREAADRVESMRGLIGETLVSIDGQGRLVANLATRWESQNGDRRWQFWLRHDVRFHDGTPLDTAAVASVISSVGIEGCPSIRGVGDSLVIECNSSLPSLPAQLALSRYSVIKEGAVGTGSFRIEEASPIKTTLAANDEYRNGRPYIAKIEITGNRSIREQLLNATVSRTDVAEVNAEAIRRAQQDHLRVLTSGNTQLIAIAIADDVDPQLRQTLAASIDRAAILNFIFQKQGEVSRGVLPNWLTGYANLFPSEPNLSRARELRSQIRQQPALRIAYDDPTLQLVAERVALNAREAGIALQPISGVAATGAGLRILRVPLTSLDPPTALSEAFRSAGVAAANTASTGIGATFRSEEQVISSAVIVPLVYVPNAVVYSERVRNASTDTIEGPDFANIWVEERR